MPRDKDDREKERREQYGEFFRRYLVQLRNALIAAAESTQPGFISDSIQVFRTLEKRNPGEYSVWLRGDELGVLPGGGGGRAAYYVNDSGPTQISKREGEREANFGLRDFDILGRFSGGVVEMEVNPLYLCEGVLPSGTGRGFYKVEVRMPGKNIFNQPPGRGPTVFSRR